MTAPDALAAERFFSGTRSKWLPLYRRLIARSKELASSEIAVFEASLRLGEIATLRATSKGIELGLRVRTAPRSKKILLRKIILSESRQIDDDLLAWIKAAKLLASSSIARLTRRKPKDPK